VSAHEALEKAREDAEREIAELKLKSDEVSHTIEPLFIYPADYALLTIHARTHTCP
jgi:hypothetical protein